MISYKYYLVYDILVQTYDYEFFFNLYLKFKKLSLVFKTIA